MSQAHEQAGRLIEAQRDPLPERVLARQLELQPELAARYTDQHRARCLEDIRYTLSFLGEAVSVAQPQLFVNYVEWARVLLEGVHVPASDLVRNLEILKEMLLPQLPPEMHRWPRDYLDAALERLAHGPVTFPPHVDPNGPLGPLAQRYLTLLLQGQRHEASTLIMAEVESGTKVRDIYLHVFQPAQREIGRLWQHNQVTVAQEHYVSASTQLIMSLLYPHIFAGEKKGRTFLAACVGKELHEIGIRMVSDFLEMEGWDTYYLGANVPARSLVQAISQRRPNVLGISATMVFHVRAVKELIQEVRASADGKTVRIMVGGHPFNVAPDLWRQVGADGHATNAQDAVTLAERLA